MSNKETKRIREMRKEEFADDPDNPQQLSMIADEIRSRIHSTKLHIYKIGELLVQAKELVEHGEFQEWIKESFDDLSYPTAVNCMRVYVFCLGRPSIVNNIKTSILYQIAAPNCPQDLREHIFEHADELNDIKNKNMRKIVKRLKKGEITIDDPQIAELFKYRQDRDTYKSYEKKVTEGIDQIKKLKDVVLSTTNKFEWPVHPEKQEIILSEDQSDEVKKWIDEIISAVTPLVPGPSDTKIKPKLKLLKGNQ